MEKFVVIYVIRREQTHKSDKSMEGNGLWLEKLVYFLFGEISSMKQNYRRGEGGGLTLSVTDFFRGEKTIKLRIELITNEYWLYWVIHE